MIHSVTRHLCLAFTLLLCSCGVSSTPPSTYSHETAAASLPDAPQTEARESGGRHRHRRRSARGGSASQAGKFDFYVMSLSWSPGFCATPAGENDSLQCGPERHFGFVLHGLWPQYERGGWPENCSTEAADEGLVNSMLTIMPSPKLVAHEWEKHGTCSGLSPQDYFEEATEAFNSVKIPPQYKAVRQQVGVSPDQVQHDFAAANPKIGDPGFVVLCSGNRRYLQEVRVCLTEDLEGRRCNAEVVHDACKADRIIMRPVR
jgi:ribonuclease T2